MSETIRGRILEVVGCFKVLDFAIFTTFNFHPDFFEQNVLPTLFGADLENTGRNARERAAHKGLMHTSVSVFYDPAVASGSAGRFRYGKHPIYLGPQRRFHPKLIVLGGKDEHETPWIYLAVMSANLTRAGWGVNGEGFADCWLHARSEQPARTLQQFLSFLSELAQKGRGSDTLARARALYSELQERRSKDDDPEGKERKKTEAQRFYAAPSYTSLWDFLTEEYGKLRNVRVASPYWGDAARIAKALGGIVPILTAARGPQDFSRAKLGNDTLRQLGVNPAAVLTWPNENARFIHLKLYEIEAKGKYLTGVGSCNFTIAGQFWQDERGRETGNVECMLFDAVRLRWPTETLQPNAILETSENEAPQTLPIYISVEFDWSRHEYRWSLNGDPKDDPVTLHLPDGAPAFTIAGKEGGKDGALNGTSFWFRWRGETYMGLVAEINLQSSDLAYGGQLSAQQILDSWHIVGRPGNDVPAEPDLPEQRDDVEAQLDDGTEAEELASRPFDWFTFFRGFEAWRKLIAAARDRRERMDLLVGRTDSVATMGIAALADSMPTAGRWIVANACAKLLRADAGAPEVAAQLGRIEQGLAALRPELIEALSSSLQGRKLKATPEGLLNWYDERLEA